jgi:hypothetical protein
VVAANTKGGRVGDWHACRTTTARASTTAHLEEEVVERVPDLDVLAVVCVCRNKTTRGQSHKAGRPRPLRPSLSRLRRPGVCVSAAQYGSIGRRCIPGKWSAHTARRR